ncbi:MAG: SIR2 family protein [Chloroflexi bacterium]|nr:SIR2 family protein [Chloroflexota bacterium]
MDDKILRVASEVYSAPKVYALLLGSGISRSAGIPTGQQLMDDLIRRIAYLHKETINEQPAEWYERHYNKKPTYGGVLQLLGRNQADRSNLLRPYFERQSDDEVEVKAPTRAHHAIARLIKEGYIQVVVTTNFDRLLEQALEAQGISPYVIRTPQDAANSVPLQNLPVTIIKLHGDYQDIGILNTAEELNAYDPDINKLLDKVLSEWGLIICGWSAESDTALQAAFSHALKSPYSTHWITYQGDMKPEAIAIKDDRGAEQINTMGADTFFDELEQNVMALKSLDSIRELSPLVAAERVRRLLSILNGTIDLETWLNAELEQAYQTFSSPEFTEQIHSSCKDWRDVETCVATVMKLYFAVLETPLHMVVTLCWHGKGELHSVLSHTLSRWMELPNGKQSSQQRFAYGRLPILLLIYAVGIATVERAGWQYLQSIFVDPFLPKQNRQQPTNILVKIFEETFGGYMVDNEYLSLGDPLHTLLRPVFQSYLQSNDRFNRVFDLFELVLNLAYLAFPFGKGRKEWIPNHSNPMESRSWDYLIQYLEEAGAIGNEWGLLKIKPFDDDELDFEGLLQLYVDALEFKKKYYRQVDYPSDLVEAYNRRNSDRIHSFSG